MSYRHRHVSPTRSPKLVFNLTQHQLHRLQSVTFARPLPGYLKVFDSNQCVDVGVSLSSSSPMYRKPYKILYHLNTGLSVFYTGDKYNDINVISDSLAYDGDTFRRQCQLLIEFHRSLGLDNIVRLRIPINRVVYVQISHEVGFMCHHVSFQKFFMMVYCNRRIIKELDEHGTHNISVSAVCFNVAFDRLMMVQEQNCTGFKFVSGSVHVHERYAECCIREMFEETNLNVRHLSTFAVHETTRFVQNKSKLHVFCVCTTDLARVNPNSSNIYHNTMDIPLCYLDSAVMPGLSSSDLFVANPQEISAAQWMAPHDIVSSDAIFSVLDKHVVAMLLLSFLRDWAAESLAVRQAYDAFLAQQQSVMPKESGNRLELCDRPLAEREHVAKFRAYLETLDLGQLLDRLMRVVSRQERQPHPSTSPVIGHRELAPDTGSWPSMSDVQLTVGDNASDEINVTDL